MIKLNKDQETAAQALVTYLTTDTEELFFSLTGDPGTGKTFMLKEALNRSKIDLTKVTGATIAHAAKNVLKSALQSEINCFTVAQWLGLKMQYEKDGTIIFKPDKRAVKHIQQYEFAILDEASMINDELFKLILKEVIDNNIKLIIVGDIYQLPPVGQEHDSKFFDSIDARLVQPMRFIGPISNLATIYKNAIKDMNDGFAGDTYALNNSTNRQDNWDSSLNSGFKFTNDIYNIIEKVADEIISHPDNLNYSRILAFKNETVNLLNSSVRDKIYGANKLQFEHNEIVISKGGFSFNKHSIIYNGELMRIEDTMPILGPYAVPCLSLKFQKFRPSNNVVIPVVEQSPSGLRKYGVIKQRLYNNALRDPRQWVYYYKFIDSFAYFDYAYSLNSYKAQGQTLKNVYVMEGEIMAVKPLSLKQKFQAIYVSVTRATDAVYIYNKNY